VERLERWIDEHEVGLPPLKHFVLPAGTSGATSVHLARAICRRAERRVVTLAADPGAAISEMLIIYLNRLSDFLFVLSRVGNQQAEQAEIAWVRPEPS
jgi:cob(I)alamin adenosyltransferase